MNYYDKNVINYIDPSIVLHPLFDEWFLITEDILLNDEFQKRKLFKHHHNLSVWDHSILVSFKAYIVSKYLKADGRICAIAGLLHDFYEQAWLYNEDLELIDDGKYLKEFNIRKPLFKMHGFTHGKVASENYIKYFPELENKRVTDAIKRHMFPLTLIPPRYKEGFIITAIDKWNSVREMPSITVVPNMVKNKALKIIFKDI